MLALCVLAGCASEHGSAPISERSQALHGSQVAPGHYRVQPGDTLYKIAFQHGQDYLDLVRWNHIHDPDRIRSGEILRIVPPDARRPDSVAVKPVIVPAPTVNPALDDESPQTWSWPLHGPILARFGAGMNKGIDIAGTRGVLIQAAANGRVVYAGSSLRGYGKLVIIRHGKTLLSAYAHNARILVQEGQHVRLGQTIAEIGDSDADRVMLHFEIREFGKPVDPMDYLPATG